MSGKLRIATHLPVGLLAPVEAAHADVEVIGVPTEGPLPPELELDVLLTLPWGAPNLPEVLARGVRWVHAYGTGVDAFPLDRLGDVVLTCSRGASARLISEWVLAVLLEAEKRLVENWIEAPPERWSLASLGSLEGRRLALIGFGGIAQAVARRALPFGMRIKALRRSDARSPIAEVELVRDLGSLLVDADHVVVAAPKTPATRHLLNDESFALVKPGAHLVNVARGGLVDADALRRALDAGRITRATLDCVEPEPLPAGHWLYSDPRVRVSPHISWSGPAAHAGLLERFVENVGRYRRGEPLAHRVDPVERY